MKRKLSNGYGVYFFDNDPLSDCYRKYPGYKPNSKYERELIKNDNELEESLIDIEMMAAPAYLTEDELKELVD